MPVYVPLQSAYQRYQNFMYYFVSIYIILYSKNYVIVSTRYPINRVYNQTNELSSQSKIIVNK